MCLSFLELFDISCYCFVYEGPGSLSVKTSERQTNSSCSWEGLLIQFIIFSSFFYLLQSNCCSIIINADMLGFCNLCKPVLFKFCYYSCCFRLAVKLFSSNWFKWNQISFFVFLAGTNNRSSSLFKDGRKASSSPIQQPFLFREFLIHARFVVCSFFWSQWYCG